MKLVSAAATKNDRLTTASVDSRAGIDKDVILSTSFLFPGIYQK